MFEGSGCFFHDKMIAPVLFISNWLLPPGQADRQYTLLDSGQKKLYAQGSKI
jgi:hypothetical protein